MRFALLGSDLDALAMARAVVRSPAHSLSWLGDIDAREVAASELARGVAISQDWETLLLGTRADAVIVARGDDDQRAEQLRKLVQEKVPLLLSHPVHPSMLIGYELEMIRKESGGLLFPVMPWRFHPLLVRLRTLLASDAHAGGLGRLEQCVIDRQLADRARESVLRQFSRDVDLARLFCGELTKVGAMAPADEAARYANLGVQLSGPTNVLVRWSAGPIEESAGARLTLTCAHGKAKLWMPEASGPWRLELQPTDGTFRLWEEEADMGELALAEFVAAVESAGVGADRPTWIDACRAVELTEAIERSLIKGRTVELYFEDYTEQGTFKGTMTSLGCGLLFFSLVLLIFGGIANQLGVPIAGYLTYFMLALLLGFLCLQLFRLVFAKES